MCLLFPERKKLPRPLGFTLRERRNCCSDKELVLFDDIRFSVTLIPSSHELSGVDAGNILIPDGHDGSHTTSSAMSVSDSVLRKFV